MSNYSKGSLNTDAQNTSWAKIFSYIDKGSTVLDIGCSSGHLGKALIKEKNCRVVGVEIDPGDYRKASQVLDEVYSFNLETDPIPEKLKKQKFDAIVLADVIEHLVDPIATLARCRPLLNKGGRLVFSIPNMSHISVRLMLLSGKFDYNETGLLDKTHLHFYDFNEVKRVIQGAGYNIEHNDANMLPYPPSFLRKKLRTLQLEDKGFIKHTYHDKNAQAFQFVGYATASNSIKPTELSTKTPEVELTEYIEGLSADYKTVHSQFKDLVKRYNHQTQLIADLRHKNDMLQSRSTKIYKAVKNNLKSKATRLKGGRKHND